MTFWVGVLVGAGVIGAPLSGFIFWMLYKLGHMFDRF